jgi:hypothetical protein
MMTVGGEIGVIPARGTRKPSKKIPGSMTKLKRGILAKILTGETRKRKMKGEVEEETVMLKRGTGNKKLTLREGRVIRGISSLLNLKNPRIFEQF